MEHMICTCMILVKFLGNAFMFQSAVILIGSPGSGKTTIGALLASQLNRKAIDFDNDVLESYWGMPVAAKVLTVKRYGIILYAAKSSENEISIKIPSNFL